ncbi:MAG: hypothetical protein WAT21_13290, partial [Saprospiraceae bacterium]
VRWENFLKPCVGLSVGKWVWSVSSYSEIVYRDKVVCWWSCRSLRLLVTSYMYTKSKQSLLFL